MQQTESSVRKVVVVNVEPEQAFAVFTKNMGQWWPKEHHIGGSPMMAVVIEPRSGGRWYEKDEDGSECDWGTVLVYEAPRRLVLSWHLNGDFEFVADIARASELEVRFTPEGRKTTVELEHRHFERHGETGDRLRTAVEGPEGWSFILANFAKAVGDSRNS
jgi:uncharacterized protein YndB with AHSA1/START domain